MVRYIVIFEDPGEDQIEVYAPDERAAKEKARDKWKKRHCKPKITEIIACGR